MALNAAISIHRCADKLMEIIERESANSVDMWKREHELQKRQIQQLAQDRDSALKEAQKAREEAQSYKAEVDRLKNGMGSYAEVGRLQTEVQSWKSKYDLAVRRQNEVQQQLGRTQARFTHTIIPIEESESPNSAERNPSALVTSAKSGASLVTGSSFHSGSPSNVYFPTNNARKYRTTIMLPTPASVAAGEPLPSTDTVTVPKFEPTLNTQELVESNSSQANLSVNSPSDEIITTRTRFAISTNTSDGKKKWCYCDSYEYGAMIMCSSPTCTKQWFHVPCTGLRSVPEGDWFCNVCTGAKVPLKPSSDT